MHLLLLIHWVPCNLLCTLYTLSTVSQTLSWSTVIFAFMSFTSSLSLSPPLLVVPSAVFLFFLLTFTSYYFSLSLWIAITQCYQSESLMSDWFHQWLCSPQANVEERREKKEKSHWWRRIANSSCYEEEALRERRRGEREREKNIWHIDAWYCSRDNTCSGWHYLITGEL